MVSGMFLFLHDDNEILSKLKMLKKDYFNENEWNECESVLCVEDNNLNAILVSIFCQLNRTFIKLYN